MASNDVDVPSKEENNAVEDEEGALPQRPPRVRKRQKLEPNTSDVGNDSSIKDEKLTDPSKEEGEQTAEVAAATGQLSAATDVPHGAQYEYMDHTADIQLHAWGTTLEDALENVALAMFNYMTPLASFTYTPEEAIERELTMSGHDMHSLLFSFLDELLFTFNTEFLVFKEIKVTSFDRSSCTVNVVGKGATFDRQRHVVGTEIKAITYSAMAVSETAEKSDIFVIVDI